MSIETVFYTQVAGIFTFIGVLFVLYRVLVQSKDATIETLRSQITFLENKVKNLAETSPDILLQRMEKRTALLTDELEQTEKEKEPLKDEIEQLRKKLVESDTQTMEEKQHLVSQIIKLTQHVSILEANHRDIESRIIESEGPYLQFLHFANAEVSSGRKHIIGEICTYLGLDFVIESKPDILVKCFDSIYANVEKNGMHTEIGINGGAMTGLWSIGIISDKKKLTLVGVSVFKTIARELKSGNSSQG
ncbi:hypothetical protein LCG94_05850 [Aeromonas salmonicida]|uniref:hypothetical protein n=1 Tax=Aeromonas salmonicida TaxID=645 RepID=UPI003BB5CEE7